MNQSDYQLAQIVNIIKRGQQLVQQASRQGADTKLAEELINEARYALKMEKREQAVEYAKKCMLEVIKSKREMDLNDLSKEGALENLTKAELRQKCQEMGLESVGLKGELIERIRDHIEKLREEKVEPEAVEEMVEEEKTVDLQEVKPEKPMEKEDWDPKKDVSDMIEGLSYLVEEQRGDKVFVLYKILLKQQEKGFAIIRKNPKLLEKKYDIDTEEFMWLTDRDVQGVKCVPPSLESIIYYIEEFMDNNYKGVVLLDGLEYLIGNNTFNPVIRFLRRLVDRVSTTECILLVSLAPETLDPSQVTLLEKDLYPIDYLSS